MQYLMYTNILIFMNKWMSIVKENHVQYDSSKVIWFWNKHNLIKYTGK